MRCPVSVKGYAARNGSHPVPLAVRLWLKVDKRGPDECWPWLAHRDKDGYGRIRLGGRGSPDVQASRVVWEVTYGPIPEGLCVLHRCDNPPCCNPAHLFLGSDADNRADKIAKRRHSAGLTHGRLRINREQGAEILVLWAHGVTQREIAEHYGVSSQLISLVCLRKTWATRPEVSP
jgi:hypothetical protein